MLQLYSKPKTNIMKFATIAILLLAVSVSMSQAQDHYLGSIQSDSLLSGYTDFAVNYANYQPDSATVAWLAACKIDSIDIVLVLGTWCGDSKRNASALLKTLDEACNALLQADCYGIAPGKQFPADIVQKYAISFVPTVIVYHKGQEVGRIVEHPAKSMEHDLMAILQPLK
jgi:hypothetical protein